MKFLTKVFNLLISLAILFFFNPLMVFAQQSAVPNKTGIALPSEPLPQLSEEDLEAMMKMLETMDDETLNALAKIGEDFIKEAESQGKDPFELLGFPVEPQNDENGEEPVTQPEYQESFDPEITQTKPSDIKVPQVDKHQVREARAMLKNITDKIATIRVKAEAERETRDKLVSLKYLLDDLVYYIHSLNQDKLLNYLTDKEFKELYKTLVQLDNDLNYLEPLFVLPEASLETINPYTVLGISRGASWAEVNEAYQKLLLEKDPRNIKKKHEETLQKAHEEYEAISEAYSTILAREQAMQSLERIIDSLIRAAYTQHVIDEIKKLLVRYEPEAVKIKEEQEALEKKARKEQEEALRRRPPFAPPVFEPLPYFGEPSFPAYEDTYITPTPTEPYYPTDTTGVPGITPTTPSLPSGARPSPDKKPKDDKKLPETKKPTEDKRKPKAESPRVNKKLENIEKELADLKGFIEEGNPKANLKSGKELFKDFNQYLKAPISKPYDASNPDIKKARDINKALSDEIISRLITIKKEVRSPVLTKFERDEIRREAKRLWDHYKKEYYTDIASLFAPGLKANASPEKRFLLFGDEEALQNIKGEGKNKAAQEDDKEERILFLQDKVGGNNQLKSLLESYTSFLNELNPTRR